jgi:hypothetical protein
MIRDAGFIEEVEGNYSPEINLNTETIYSEENIQSLYKYTPTV